MTRLGVLLGFRSTAARDLQLRIGYSDGLGGTAFFTTVAPLSFQIMANTLYHVGFTLNTDGTGLTTARIFGVQGTGAIDTTAATALLSSSAFNLDEALVSVGFPGGNYLFGSRPAGAPKVQDFRARCLQLM